LPSGGLTRSARGCSFPRDSNPDVCALPVRARGCERPRGLRGRKGGPALALVKSISSARRAVLCAVGCVALLAAFLSSAAAQTRVGFGVQHEQVAGAGGTLLWAARYDAGNGDDAASALAVRPVGGGFFVTGSSAGASTGDDYATIAYTSTGTMSWVSRYDGPSHAHDAAFALAVSPDGSKVFVAGESTGNAGLGYATIAYGAATGAELWAKRYESSNGGPGSASSVDVSPDGSRVFVTGTSSSSYASIAYDAATGATLWRRRYDGPGAGADSAAALAVSPDGSKVFVTGTSGGGATGDDYATVAYDAVTGATVWVKRSDRRLRYRFRAGGQPRLVDGLRHGREPLSQRRRRRRDVRLRRRHGVEDLGAAPSGFRRRRPPRAAPRQPRRDQDLRDRHQLRHRRACERDPDRRVRRRNGGSG